MSIMGHLAAVRAQALSFHYPGMPTGRWAWTVTNGNTQNITPPAANRITTYPWFCPRTITVSNLFFLTNTGGAGSALKPGIFASDPVTGLPAGTPIIAVNAGVDTTGAFLNVVAITPTVLQGGLWYWPFGKFTGTAPQMQGVAASGGTQGNMTFAAAADAGGNNVFFVSDAYTNDITTFNATGQSWLVSSGGVPCVGIGF
jgi:hypothetical protein